MTAPLEALLRAALADTGIEGFVCDLAEEGGLEKICARLLERADAEDREALQSALRRALESRQPLEHEYHGRGRIFRIAGRFVDETTLAGTIVDASADQRRVTFEQIVENIPDFIARVDLDGRFIYLNRASEGNAFGLPRSAVIGKTPGELGFNPASARLLREAELRVIATGAPQRLEVDLTHLPGRTFDLVLIPERDETGRLVSILRVTRDVTALKEAERLRRISEERLQLAARASLAMIYDWDMLTDVTYRSDAVRELTGFSPEETQRSEWWLADIHPDDRAAAEERVRQAIARGEDRFDNEYRVRHRDGNWRWVWDRGFIMRDGSGRAVRVVGSAVDVTARRLAEEELKAAHRREQDARAEAEQANRAKDEFLATLSHELRTPMTSILGWTSMMSSGMVDPESTALAIRSIHDSARAQAQLIEDLLDISRVAAGKLAIEWGTVDLVSIVASAVESFRIAAAAQSIDLRVSAGTSDLLVLGDEKRMRQVITNLIGNALKFTPPGGRIEVGLIQEENKAVVVVRDNGMGIEPHFLPHVFDRFSQQETIDGRSRGGLGLGLAIVRQLVEIHGGSVTAHSEGPGKGSAFTLTLPRLLAPIRPLGDSRGGGRPLPRLDGIHVLLVEDEPHSRTYMKSVLASSGAVVRAAASVQEALDGPDDLTVLVSDIAMPGADGLALIATLRSRDAANGRHTPAVAVTALGYGDDRRRILSAGFDEYLAKPVEPLTLLETVQKLVRSRST